MIVSIIIPKNSILLYLLNDLPLKGKKKKKSIGNICYHKQKFIKEEKLILSKEGFSRIISNFKFYYIYIYIQMGALIRENSKL
jgi:hypothetical protein